MKQTIPPEIRAACIPLVYNWDDAVLAAKLDSFKQRAAGIARDALKDDLKIIASAMNRDVAYLITGDKDFFNFCERLRTGGKIKFAPIFLGDGFDKAHLEGGQMSFPVSAENILKKSS